MTRWQKRGLICAGSRQNGEGRAAKGCSHLKSSCQDKAPTQLHDCIAVVKMCHQLFYGKNCTNNKLIRKHSFTRLIMAIENERSVLATLNMLQQFAQTATY